MALRGRNSMRRIDAAKVRELFARQHLNDWDVVKLTGLAIATVKNIQVDGARTTDYVIRLLTMYFKVTRDELILGGER